MYPTLNPKTSQNIMSEFLALGEIFWIVTYEDFHFSVTELYYNNWISG